jgi:hypothetical protein
MDGYFSGFRNRLSGGFSEPIGPGRKGFRLLKNAPIVVQREKPIMPCCDPLGRK